MKHTLKKMAVLLGSSICFLQMAVIPVMAETTEESQFLWSDFASDGVMSVEDTATPRARGDILNRGYVKLSNLDGRAGIYGETLCNFALEEVGLELYLEKYNGSMFTSFGSWDCIEYNTYQALKALTVSVDKGYYYRLRGYHYAANDGLYENVITTTDGLPIK